MTGLLHIGDFHAAPGPRNADRYRALEQILAAGFELAAKGELGAWLWPGDLNDARMTIEDRNRLAEVLLDMARVAPVVLAYGNHDVPGDLEIFARLKGPNPIYVVDRPCSLRIRLATMQFATIFVLPYPQKAGLAGAGVAPGAVVSTAADVLEPIFMVAAAELETAREAGDLTLMIGHVNVAGAQLSNGQPNIGHEIELSPKHLERLGPIYKGLNHIHKPQVIAGAHYAGSVCRLDYGETEEKRFLIVWYGEDGRTAVTSRPIDVAPMFHVTGTLGPGGFVLDDAAAADVKARFLAGDWAGCDVRCRYSYKSSEKAALNETLVRALFSSALRLKIESVVIPDRELRAPAVALAKTLPDKLAAYFKVETLSPAVAEKLASLEQQDLDQVLGGVARTLAGIEQHERASVAA